MEPPLGQVGMHRHAGFPVKQAHHVKFADEKPLCQAVDVQILRKVSIQILHDFQYPVIFRHTGTGQRGAVVMDAPAQFYQKLQKHRLTEDGSAKGVVGKLCFQPGGQIENPSALGLFQPQHMAVLPLKQGKQRTVGGGHLLQKIRGYIDDDPLVRGILRQIRPVHAAAADQHNIPGAQKIAPAVDEIAAPPGNQQQNFAEFVVVIVRLRAGSGAQVEQPEILQKIPPLFIFCHGDSSKQVIFCKQYTRTNRLLQSVCP